jgi:hypothetical protein
MASQARYLRPHFDAVSGRKISRRVVENIIAGINRDAGAPQCVVIILGSNNLRRRSEGPEDIMPFFKSIVDHVSSIDQCHVVITSIIPSPATNETFGDTNTQLKVLCRENKESCSFLNLTPGLCDIDGEIEHHHYKIDKIHLNGDGASIIASTFRHTLMNVRKGVFNHKPIVARFENPTP